MSVKPFLHGKYETRGGFKAIVCQTKITPIQRAFMLRGAVKEKDSNLYVLTSWFLDGKNMGIMSESFDLQPQE